MNGELVHYETARRALAQASTVDEVLRVRDAAQQAVLYAKQAKDTELIERATEIQVRAQRRCGEMLREGAKNGHRDNGSGGDRRSRSKPTTVKLTDIGLTKDQSSRYQKLAAIPEKQFERTVELAKSVAGEVSTAFMLKANTPRRRSDRNENAIDVPVVMPPDKTATPLQAASAMFHAIEDLARLPFPVAVLYRALPEFQHYHVHDHVDAAIAALREIRATWKRSA